MGHVSRSHQQGQLEELLRSRGWCVVDRSVLTASYWLDEVWTIESEWSPVGQRAFISFVVDRQAATLSRQPGQFVSSVGVSRIEPVESPFGSEVYLRPQWNKVGLPAVAALLDALRIEGSREVG